MKYLVIGLVVLSGCSSSPFKQGYTDSCVDMMKELGYSVVFTPKELQQLCDNRYERNMNHH